MLSYIQSAMDKNLLPESSTLSEVFLVKGYLWKVIESHLLSVHGAYSASCLYHSSCNTTSTTRFMLTAADSHTSFLGQAYHWIVSALTGSFSTVRPSNVPMSQKPEKTVNPYLIRGRGKRSIQIHKIVNTGLKSSQCSDKLFFCLHLSNQAAQELHETQTKVTKTIWEVFP